MIAVVGGHKGPTGLLSTGSNPGASNPFISNNLKGGKRLTKGWEAIRGNVNGGVCFVSGIIIPRTLNENYTA